MRDKLMCFPTITSSIIIYYQASRVYMQCPTHIKKLQKILQPSGGLCNICCRQAVYECKDCNFLLCDECRICTKRHGMLKIIDLVVSLPQIRPSSPNTTITHTPVIVAPRAKLSMMMVYGIAAPVIMIFALNAVNDP